MSESASDCFHITVQVNNDDDAASDQGAVVLVIEDVLGPLLTRSHEQRKNG